MQLVLSIFHGADLFGRGFEQEGFCVVRAGEYELGFDIRNFQPSRHKFDGVIGGSPCQEYSTANRTSKHDRTALNCDCYSCQMLKEFTRVVTEAQPEWFLHENVPGVPDLPPVFGYTIQRFDLNALDCGLKQNRPRHFQFGYKSGNPLHLERLVRDQSQFERCVTASEQKKDYCRTLPEVCELQGLPRNFRLPLLTVAKNYEVIGNGVPPPMARLAAKAIKARTVTNFPPARHTSDENFLSKSHTSEEKKQPAQSQFYVNESQKNNYRAVTLCKCGCGRRVTGRAKTAKAACRKRLERRNKISQAQSQKNCKFCGRGDTIDASGVTI